MTNHVYCIYNFVCTQDPENNTENDKNTNTFMLIKPCSFFRKSLCHCLFRRTS